MSRPWALDCSTALLQLQHLHNCYQRETHELNPTATHSYLHSSHGINDMIISSGFCIEVGLQSYISLTNEV